MFITCDIFSKMLVSKLQLVIKKSFLKKLWKNTTILVQNLVSRFDFDHLSNNVIYALLSINDIVL